MDLNEPVPDFENTVDYSNEILQNCVICLAGLNTNKIFIRSHYIHCLFSKGAWTDVVPPVELNSKAMTGLFQYHYLCQYNNCTRSKMNYRDFCFHMGVQHEKLCEVLLNWKSEVDENLSGSLKDICYLLYPLQQCE